MCKKHLVIIQTEFILLYLTIFLTFARRINITILVKTTLKIKKLITKIVIRILNYSLKIIIIIIRVVTIPNDLRCTIIYFHWLIRLSRKGSKLIKNRNFPNESTYNNILNYNIPNDINSRKTRKFTKPMKIK